MLSTWCFFALSADLVLIANLHISSNRNIHRHVSKDQNSGYSKYKTYCDTGNEYYWQHVNCIICMIILLLDIYYILVKLLVMHEGCIPPLIQVRMLGPSLL
jgi:hypothetical protein